MFDQAMSDYDDDNGYGYSYRDRKPDPKKDRVTIA